MPSNTPTLTNFLEFRENHSAGNEEFLFNELHGRRLIEEVHKHTFFIIILFQRGSGTHHIDAIDYPIGNQEIHVLFPDQPHRWDIHEGTVAYQLMVERALFEQFAPFFRFSFTNYQNHPVIKLSDAAFAMLLHEFYAIKDELQTSNPLKQLIHARAGVIAAIVSKQAEEKFTAFKIYQSNPRLALYNTLIDQFYKEQKAVSFYAEKLHISANYLTILCKKHLGVSATQLIHQRICTEAKRLLQKRNLTVKEISFDLGFTEHAYFSNFFKTQTGLTPSEFREHV